MSWLGPEPATDSCESAVLTTTPQPPRSIVNPWSKDDWRTEQSCQSYSHISTPLPVIFPRLWSQTAINSTADRSLSSIPRLLDQWPGENVEQRSANGVVCNEGNVSSELSAYGSRMNTVRCHFCTCQSTTKYLFPYDSKKVKFSNTCYKRWDRSWAQFSGLQVTF